jgi:hypothetical protein
VKRLTLAESVFAGLLPDARRENEYGWGDELGHLREFLATRVGA